MTCWLPPATGTSPCTLELFPLHGDCEERARTAQALLTGYGRACTFIDDHASLPITIDDIAEAAGLSAGQRDAAIRAHSPLSGTRQALNRARLDAAHHDLVGGDPTHGDTVRCIALRWGFLPGTFTRAYRRAYGINPVDRLRG